MFEKECKVCKLAKSVSEYHKKPGGVMGIETTCKECVSKAKAARFQAKKIAKEARKKDRCRSEGGKRLKVQIKFLPHSEKDMNEILGRMIEAINESYLKAWEDKKWEGMGEPQESNEEFLIAG